jgi:hypothetical protein
VQEVREVKRAALVSIGFLPLPIGFLINHLMMTIWFYTFPGGTLFSINIAILVLWFICGWFYAKFFYSKREPLLLLNSAAILAIVLILFQMLVIGRFWPNWFGITPQFFYLPLMNLASRLMSFVASLVPFTITVPAWFFGLIEFCSLLLVSYFGIRLGHARR